METDLDMVRRHVKEGEVYIARQEALVAKLECDGYNTAEAKILLRLFRSVMRLHQEHLHRLEGRS